VWFQKISIPPPQRVIGNSKRPNFFKGMYEPELEFPEGWAFQNPKKPFVGGGGGE